MIDLETLGVLPSAPVVAIGAVFFDRQTGMLGEKFYAAIRFDSACEKRKPDANTIAWWFKQSDESRMALLAGTYTTEDALLGLSDFLKPGVNTWGNGATFDISILESLYRDYGALHPWEFWQVRDCRTIEDVSPVGRDCITRGGTHHNALDDAIYQAQYISAMIQVLTK